MPPTASVYCNYAGRRRFVPSQTLEGYALKCACWIACSSASVGKIADCGRTVGQGMKIVFVTPAKPHLLEITKLTTLFWLPVTVTDFSQLFGSVKTGRSTLNWDKTS